MGLIFVRTCIVFITLFIVMRLMGKRQIGEMQPFEFVITLVIAELACIPMADVSIPLLYGVVSILTIYLLHQIVCLLDLYCPWSKAILSGKPSVVIDKNGVDFKQLKKNNLDITDLMESLRGLGYFSLQNVDYALYESNGNFSALESKDKGYISPSYLVIINGKFQEQELKNGNFCKGDIEKYLLSNHFCLQQILIMTVNNEGLVYLQERRKPRVMLKMEKVNG